MTVNVGHQVQERIQTEDLEYLKSSYLEMFQALQKTIECPICLETIGNDKLQINNCGHLMCKDCYNRLQEKKCPVCRRPC